MTDNVVYLGDRFSVTLEDTESVCEIAGKTLNDVVIIGEAEDGTIKMLTTQSDIGTILFYLEATKTAMMTGGLDAD
jgi:hypothetical protein